LTLLFDVELLRRCTELLLCTTRSIALLLGREAQSGCFLTGAFTGFLRLQLELALLLTSRLLGLESAKTKTGRFLSSSLLRLERT
jgi:hypothetical protein